jgi:hypothetical protein
MSGWKAAFLKQAQSDYFLYKEMNRTHKPVCHQMHYLQMCCEKLAKVILAPTDGSRPKASHYLFKDALRQLKQRPNIVRALHYENKKDAFSSAIDSLIPFAEKIEKLVPQDEFTPNSEYPWDRDGMIQAPVEYEFKEITESIQINKLNRLLENLFEISAIL